MQTTYDTAEVAQYKAISISAPFGSVQYPDFNLASADEENGLAKIYPSSRNWLLVTGNTHRRPSHFGAGHIVDKTCGKVCLLRGFFIYIY